MNIVVGNFPSSPPKLHSLTASLSDGSGRSAPCSVERPQYAPSIAAYEFAAPLPSVFLGTQLGPKPHLLTGRYTFALRYTVGGRHFSHAESFTYDTRTSVHADRLRRELRAARGDAEKRQ